MTDHERPPLLGRLLLAVTERLRGSRPSARLATIEAAPRRPREEIFAAQLSRLRALVSHAERRVPYYRELFASLGIASRDIRTFDDFARLPVLTKAIIRERLGELVRDDVPHNRLRRCSSGGSTGVPLDFYVDDEYLELTQAGIYRNLCQAGWRPGEMVAYFWGGNEKLDRMPRWEFEVRQRLRRMYQLDPFHSGPDDMARWLARWPRLGARAALGYASTIARFAEFVEAQGVRLAPVRGVFTTAEKLYPGQRAGIARVFGSSVFDCYGSSEVRNIATECPRGRMHINADFVHVEVEGPAGSPAPLVVTSLLNRAMPFIRYVNEDVGQLEEGGCDCGSNFPLMRLDVARVSDSFVLPGGRVVHGEFFTHLLYGSAGVERFQFHQTAPDSITLWVVPRAGDAEGRRHAIARALAGIADLAGGAVRVEVREVEQIPPTAAGKHRFTRSDVTATLAGARAVARPAARVS